MRLVIEESTSHSELQIGRVQDSGHVLIVEPLCDMFRKMIGRRDEGLHFRSEMKYSRHEYQGRLLRNRRGVPVPEPCFFGCPQRSMKIIKRRPPQECTLHSRKHQKPRNRVFIPERGVVVDESSRRARGMHVPFRPTLVECLHVMY